MNITVVIGDDEITKIIAATVAATFPNHVVADVTGVYRSATVTLKEPAPPSAMKLTEALPELEPNAEAA